MGFKNLFLKISVKNLAIITGMLIFAYCQPDLEKIETITAEYDEPVESLFDVEIVQSSYAKTQAIIKSPRIDRYDNDQPYLELPEGLEVVFYDTLMNPTSRLKANYAISYDIKKIIEAKNDVVVVNEFNEKLNTEHLIWDQKQEIIYSDKFVKITTETEVLYGDGFESDERFEKWKILHPRGTFKIEEP